MDDLLEFINDRLDEREQWIKTARLSSKRRKAMLREVNAMRTILGVCGAAGAFAASAPFETPSSAAWVAREVAWELAGIWADHPEYRVMFPKRAG